MKAKPQTSDPGENHSNNSKNGGVVDFTGQEYYDEQKNDTPASEAAEPRDAAPVKFSDTSNPYNGSGGSRKTFSSGQVKGSNP